MNGFADELPFASLDFLYVPSRDVERDAGDLVNVLGGRQVFAVRDGHTNVAMIAMTAEPPHILLTDHLEGDRPILIYRVENMTATVHRLEAAGWERSQEFEIPHGPCVSFRTPNGHRLAIYQPLRPDATGFFAGRQDF